MNIKRKISNMYYRMLASEVSIDVKKRGMTYLSYEKLVTLEAALREVERENCPGDIVEAGVARGGAGIVLAKNMSGGRRYWGYDSFESMPEPSEKDGDRAHRRYDEIASGEAQGIAGKNYYGYEDNLLDTVRDNFEAFGLSVESDKVNLIPGYFEERFVMDRDVPVALAHIDCDWYESVSLVLSRVKKSIPKGGVIVVDDYNEYEGAKRATKEFIYENRKFSTVKNSSSATIKRTKSR